MDKGLVIYNPLLGIRDNVSVTQPDSTSLMKFERLRRSIRLLPVPNVFSLSLRICTLNI